MTGVNATARAPETVVPARAAALLDVQALGFAAGPRALLSDVSFSARPGEFLALLGPNGAGKSTLLKILAGEYAPRGGTVLLQGRALSQWRGRELARVRAVMPQSVSVTFEFAAAEIVALGLPGRDGGNAQHPVVYDLMRWLQVDHLARRAYPSLSGGEQQRVQLARVLAQVWTTPGPRLLLLDECTSALDPAHQYRIMSILRMLVLEAGFTVIAACHDLDLAAAHADRALLMAQGRLVADGAIADVLTAQRLADVYGIDARVHAGERPRVEIRGGLERAGAVPRSLAGGVAGFPRPSTDAPAPLRASVG